MVQRSVLLLATALSASFGVLAAEPVPYGHPDFLPTPQRPIGFRGDGTGHFPGATPPLTFSEKDGKNVRWSVKMPSWSQSSPIVVGKYVVTAAEPDTTMCVDADTGRILWQDALGLFPKLTLDPENPKESGKYVQLWSGNGYSWPCSDGEQVYKAWNGGKSKDGPTAALVCYEVATGKRLWLIEFSGDFQKHKFTRDGNRWGWKTPDGAPAATQHSDWAPSGYASPQTYGDTVIYQAKGAGSVLVALDSKTGTQRWVSKPAVFGHSGSDANFLILSVASRDVLVTNIGMVLDPRTGDVLGEAIPSVERDGQRVSRLWGVMETTPRDEVKVAGLSPIAGLGAEGAVAFGPDWPRTDAAEPAGAEPSGKGAYHYLAVRLGFDARGKLTTTCLFPQRAVVPKLEYGNAHMTIMKDRLLVMPGYGRTLAAIVLDSGELVTPPKPLWPTPPQARSWGLKPDPNAPDIKAGLEEFGLTIAAVTEFNRGIGRNGYSSYSRTFVDGRGHIWYMNRQAQFYRIDPGKDFAAELAGTLVHPECWTSNSSPVPHGNRIYVRTFGRLACIEDPKAAEGRAKAEAVRRRLAGSGVEAIGALIESLGDDHEEVRWTALDLLRSRPAAVIPATHALGDANPHRRRFAARLLGDFGATAASAAPALAKLMAGDAERDVRVEAGRALKATGAVEGITGEIVRAAGDPSVEVRKLAASLLARIGPEGAAAVPALMEQVREDLAPLQRELATIDTQPVRDSRLRHSLGDQPTLSAMGRMGGAAVPSAIEMLRSTDQAEMRWACAILAGVGPEATTALPALREAATHPSPEIKAAAEAAIKAIAAGRRE